MRMALLPRCQNYFKPKTIFGNGGCASFFAARGDLGETAAKPAKAPACRDAWDRRTRSSPTQCLEDSVMTKTTKTTKKGGKGTKSAAKFILGLAAAASIATTMMPSEAEAGWRGRRNWAIAGGVAAGLLGGALIAGAAQAHSPYYAAPSYDCYWVKQRRVTWDGFVVIRNVRVCD
jgi:hypothetical protein